MSFSASVRPRHISGRGCDSMGAMKRAHVYALVATQFSYPFLGADPHRTVWGPRNKNARGEGQAVASLQHGSTPSSSGPRYDIPDEAK